MVRCPEVRSACSAAGGSSGSAEVGSRHSSISVRTAKEGRGTSVFPIARALLYLPRLVGRDRPRPRAINIRHQPRTKSVLGVRGELLVTSKGRETTAVVDAPRFT